MSGRRNEQTWKKGGRGEWLTRVELQKGKGEKKRERRRRKQSTWNGKSGIKIAWTHCKKKVINLIGN